MQTVHVLVALNKDPKTFIMGVYNSYKAANDAKKVLIKAGYQADELYVQQWQVSGHGYASKHTGTVGVRSKVARGTSDYPDQGGDLVSGLPGISEDVFSGKH